MKVAFFSCSYPKHPCGGAAACMRMFRQRVGEFGIYPEDAWLASVSCCDYCQNKTENLDAIADVLKKEGIEHIHLAACTSICPCGNYDTLKAYWQDKGFIIGEYHGCDAD